VPWSPVVTGFAGDNDVKICEELSISNIREHSVLSQYARDGCCANTNTTPGELF